MTAEDREIVLIDPDADAANGNGHGSNGAPGNGISRRGFLLTTGAATAAVAAGSTSEIENGAASRAFAAGNCSTLGTSLKDVFTEFTSFFPSDAFEIPHLDDIASGVNFVGSLFECGQATQTITLKVPASVLDQGQFNLSIPGLPVLGLIIGPDAGWDVDVYLHVQIDVATNPTEIAITFTECAYVPAGDPEPDDLSYSIGIPLTFQITNSLLQPKVVTTTDANGVPTAFTDKLDENGNPSDYFLEVKTPPAFQYSDNPDPQIRVSFGTHWNLELLDAAGDPVGFAASLVAPDPAEVAGSGVIVQLNGFGLNFDRSTPPETQGVYLNADIFFTTSDSDSSNNQETTVFEADLTGIKTDGTADPTGLALIGPGGFTGFLTGKIPSGGLSTTLFGAQITLNSAGIGLRQNALQTVDIAGTIILPWLNGPLDVTIGLHLNNDLVITLDTSKHPAVVSLPHVADFAFKKLSIDYDLNDHKARFTTDCSVKPTFNLSPIETPPPFDLNGLTFEPPDKITIKGGWINLVHAEQLKIAGFNMDLTKIGFGTRDPSTDHFIGFSGGISFVDGLPQGISVEGLRVYYNPSTYALTGFDLKGIGLQLAVPGSFAFDGKVEFGKEQFSDGNTYDVASGSINLNIIPLNLRVDARLLIITKPFPAFFIDMASDLPSPGVMLGASGLALYSIEGLFAYHMKPNKAPTEAWYGDYNAKTGWFWKAPAGQINDPLKKWVPAHGALAFGVGITLGTAGDNGHAFAMKALLVLTLPGPTIIIEGAATFLKGRDDLAPGKSPPFEALMVIEPDDILINVGVHGTFPSADKPVIKLDADAEVYFDFHEARNWHLYIGQEPPEKRIQAEILKLFKANAYFMLTNDWLKLGAHIGIDESYGSQTHQSGGGVSVTAAIQVKFSAYIDGEAQISRRPFQLEGGLHAHGELSVSVVLDIHVHIHIPIPFCSGITIDFKLHFALSFGATIDTTLQGQAPKPFYVSAEFKLSIQLPYLGSIPIDIPITLGSLDDLPDLQSVLERDEQSHLLNINLVHPLAAQLHDATGAPYTSLPVQTPKSAGATDVANAVAAAMNSRVPVDWRPVITFKQDVHNDSGFADPQAPVPSTVALGDYTYEYHLTGLKIYEVDNPTSTPLDKSKDVTASFGGKWQMMPGSGQQPAQRALVINSNDALLFLTSSSTSTYSSWVGNAYPYYCCGLPLSNPAPMITVQVKQQNVTGSPNPNARTTPFSIEGLIFDPDGTLVFWSPVDSYLIATTLTITFPTPVNTVTLKFNPTGRSPTGQATGMFAGKAVTGTVPITTVVQDGVVVSAYFTVKTSSASGMDSIILAVSELELYEVDYFEQSDLAASNDAATLTTNMTTWTSTETDHWNLDLAIFKPNTVYRLELTTTAEVSRSNPANDSGPVSNPETLNGSGPDIVFFATAGPPVDDQGVAVGKYPLIPYLDYQLPLPDSGIQPPLVPPLQNGWTLPGNGENFAYLGYDVNVGFNQPWVTAMFTDSTGKPNMRIELYDANGNAVPGSLAYVGDINHQNTMSEEESITIVTLSSCCPTGSITIPSSKLTSVTQGGLTPNSVYRAELHWTDAASVDHLLYRWGFKTGVFDTFTDMILSGADPTTSLNHVWPFQAPGVNISSLAALVNGSAPEADRFDAIATLFHRTVTIGKLPAVTEVTLVQTTTARGLQNLALLIETPQPIDWSRQGTAVTVDRVAALRSARVTRRRFLRMRPEIAMAPKLVRNRDGTRVFLFFPAGSSFAVPHGLYTLTWTLETLTSNPSDPIYTSTINGVSHAFPPPVEKATMTFRV